jgi:hypothetical protein
MLCVTLFSKKKGSRPLLDPTLSRTARLVKIKVDCELDLLDNRFMHEARIA